MKHIVGIAEASEGGKAMKRYVTIAEFQRLSGLAYPTIKNALETGQLKGIQTEAGHWKIDTAAAGDDYAIAIFERLDKQEHMLRSLCAHLGISCTGETVTSGNIAYIGRK